MPLRTLLLLMLVVFCFSVLGCNSPKPERLQPHVDSKFKTGQVWKYKARPGEEASRVKILMTETDEKLGTIVYISITELKYLDPETEKESTYDHTFLPISKSALVQSVTELESENAEKTDLKKILNDNKENLDKQRMLIEAGQQRMKDQKMTPIEVEKEKVKVNAEIAKIEIPKLVIKYLSWKIAFLHDQKSIFMTSVVECIDSREKQSNEENKRIREAQKK